MGVNKQYVFILFFNYKDNKERMWAEKKRNDAIAYLKRLFENKAKFSCVARDESTSCLMLKGFMNLNLPCTQEYAKRLLGKYSSCKPSYFGDLVSLCRFVHIDRNLMTTGRLPKSGNNSIKNLKPFATDPKFVVKILLDSIDKNDFGQNKGNKDNESVNEIKADVEPKMTEVAS